MPNSPHVKHPFWNAYRTQRKNARKRGIAFLLSFEDWLAIWKKSKRLSLRGVSAGKYCMARLGDKGAYEMGNVKIILTSRNVAEAVHSEESRISRRRSMTGKIKITEEGRQRLIVARTGANNPMFGKPRSARMKKRISLCYWEEKRCAC